MDEILDYLVDAKMYLKDALEELKGCSLINAEEYEYYSDNIQDIINTLEIEINKFKEKMQKENEKELNKLNQDYWKSQF